MSACTDDCSLVGLDLLNIVKLETLNQKIVARRAPGRPRATSSIHQFLKRMKNDENREKLLENFLKQGHGKNFYQIFAHQIIRESEGAEYLAVIRAFQKDAKNNITGAIVYYPYCEITNENSSEIENHEDIIETKDLACDILISHDNSNFKPFVANRNDDIGKEFRGNEEGAFYPHYCKCRVKAKVETVKKNSENKGKKFWCCPKHQHDPTKCDYFSWYKE